jgi:hypothetical protein
MKEEGEREKQRGSAREVRETIVVSWEREGGTLELFEMIAVAYIFSFPF